MSWRDRRKRQNKCEQLTGWFKFLFYISPLGYIADPVKYHLYNNTYTLLRLDLKRQENRQEIQQQNVTSIDVKNNT